jgi:glycosyltransferase involved in cell wall biosynthesis
MLSILIPVYNYDIREFVTELHKQATSCKIPFEILCYDDASSGHFQSLNRELEQLENVIYRELPHNMGRSAIRNMLAKQAVYEYLLFLDCDSFPEYPDFIARYANNLNPAMLLYGGRTYEPDPPADPQRYLRWYYGMHREVYSAEYRRKKPYHSFQTNNFVIPCNMFRSIGLNEKLKGYGHEDTQFGQQLMARNIRIIHIDNPLRHLGLETATEFIQKTHEGIANLKFLIAQGNDVSTVKLARVYRFLKNWGLAKIFAWLIGFRKKALIKNLHSPKPSLRAFDLYKLLKLVKMDTYRNRE